MKVLILLFLIGLQIVLVGNGLVNLIQGYIKISLLISYNLVYGLIPLVILLLFAAEDTYKSFEKEEEEINLPPKQHMSKKKKRRAKATEAALMTDEKKKQQEIEEREKKEEEESHKRQIMVLKAIQCRQTTYTTIFYYFTSAIMLFSGWIWIWKNDLSVTASILYSESTFQVLVTLTIIFAICNAINFYNTIYLHSLVINVDD